MARHKNANWTLPEANLTYDAAALAVLMDIRDELQAIRRLAECSNVRNGLVAAQRIDRRLQASGMLVGKGKRA